VAVVTMVPGPILVTNAGLAAFRENRVRGQRLIGHLAATQWPLIALYTGSLVFFSALAICAALSDETRAPVLYKDLWQTTALAHDFLLLSIGPAVLNPNSEDLRVTLWRLTAGHSWPLSRPTPEKYGGAVFFGLLFLFIVYLVMG
jgi:hypothetical protein